MSVGPRGLRAAALIGVISSVSTAQSAPPIARYVPPAPDPAHVFVLDSAHILAAGTIAALQDSALALQAETRADVAWVTLPTLGGRTIEEAALYIGRTWRIGTRGTPGDPLRNRGLVVVYVPDKSKTAGSNFRIEVGNGLEGTITDSRSRSITTAMRDYLRAGQYDSAYAAGWTVAAAMVRQDFAAHAAAVVASPAPASGAAPAQHGGASLVNVIVVVLVLVLVLIVLVVIAERRKRRSPTLGSHRGDDADEERRRRSVWTGAAFGSSASGVDSSSDSGRGSDSGSSSSGGDFGGGGGFSGGGSSDSI